MECSMGKWVLWIYICCIQMYLPNYLRYRVPIFKTTHHTITIYENPLLYVGVLHMWGTDVTRSQMVQNGHIFRQEHPNQFKFGMYVEGSCRPIDFFLLTNCLSITMI